jgi:hypothetical protein
MRYSVEGAIMRVWLIGADEDAINALRQLRKNLKIEIVVSASEETPLAVQKGVLEKVDFVETVTQVNINRLAHRVRPDLILIDSAEGKRSYGWVDGGMVLADALTNEIARASDYPCLVL